MRLDIYLLEGEGSILDHEGWLSSAEGTPVHRPAISNTLAVWPFSGPYATFPNQNIGQFTVQVKAVCDWNVSKCTEMYQNAPKYT